jgi:release factor glutamine methyltransferase
MQIYIQVLLQQLHKRLQPHSDTPLLDAQVLVAHHLEKPRTWVLAHPETAIDAAQSIKIYQSVHRLEAGEPLPYVISHWEFFGLDFELNPSVLIPRPETELLVEEAISWLQAHPHKRSALDIGTGSGCIGITLAKHIPNLHLLMTDISPESLEVARLNAEKHNVLEKVDLLQSNIFEQVPTSSLFDLICANLPYIPTEKLTALSVAQSEPRLALDGGVNGLTIIKHLLEQVKTHISPGGIILLEIDPDQRIEMVQFLQENLPSAKVNFLQDLSGRDRCVEIHLPYLIYHLCTREDWLKAEGPAVYQPTSLSIEGFIHCSRADQYIDVANRYYKGVSDLVLLSIDPDQIASEIRWEKSGNSYYPHIYGPINLDAVISIDALLPDSDGIYQNNLPAVKTN